MPSAVLTKQRRCLPTLTTACTGTCTTPARSSSTRRTSALMPGFRPSASSSRLIVVAYTLTSALSQSC